MLKSKLVSTLIWAEQSWYVIQTNILTHSMLVSMPTAELSAHLTLTLAGNCVNGRRKGYLEGQRKSEW